MPVRIPCSPFFFHCHRAVFLFILIFLSVASTTPQVIAAGGVRGTITDTNGEPLPGASILVVEENDGTITNVEGQYEITLKPGKYTLLFQFLGYSSQTQAVTVTEDTYKRIDIKLKAQGFNLEGLEVRAKSDNLANVIMRKVIAKADYHFKQVDAYTSEVYIKGGGRFTKIPWALKGTMKKEGVDTSTAYLLESVSQISYKRPSKYTERVISIRTQGNAPNMDANQFFHVNFYQPRPLDEIKSPLSPGAFLYYTFKYEGNIKDQDREIHKIRVTPRTEGENVVKGYLYILDDAWSIYAFDFTTYKLGAKIKLEQQYMPVGNNVWLPLKQHYNISGSILGFKGYFDYLLSSKNYKVTVNPNLPAYIDVYDQKTETSKEEILAGKQPVKKEKPPISFSDDSELSAKDLRKTMSDMAKQEEEQRKAEWEKEKAARKQSEKKGTVTQNPKPNQPDTQTPANDSLAVDPGLLLSDRTYNIDSNAARMDSLYWASVRPIPLTIYEQRSYQKVDSLAAVEAVAKQKPDSTKTTTDTSSVKKVTRKNAFKLSHTWEGHTYDYNKIKSSFTLGNLAQNALFNPIDGYYMALPLTWAFIRKDYKGSSIQLTPRYAFAREKFDLSGIYKKSFNPHWKMEITGGTGVQQYNRANPMNPYINMLSNLFEERNHIHLYGRTFGRASATYTHGKIWNLTGWGEWSERQTLYNNSSFTLFPKTTEGTYAPNVPVNNEVRLPQSENERALVFNVRLNITPKIRYEIRNGKKKEIRYDYPAFTLDYQKGIPNVGGSISDFNRLEASAANEWRVGPGGKIKAKLEAGSFFNANHVHFGDFKHFPGNRTFITTADIDSYRLLDLYQYSTKDQYISLNGHYQTRRLLLTQVAHFRLLGWKEGFFVNYLTTPTIKNYTEVGYSLDNLFRFFRIDVAAGYYQGRVRNVGVLVGFSGLFSGDDGSINISF